MKFSSAHCRLTCATDSSRFTPTIAGTARKDFQGRGRGSRSGFTMVEIALCLAIIGFALVAIIGVLPAGLGVQQDNREETIINQDAALWMDTLRNGGQGYDDLTNCVISITNIVWYYEIIGNNQPSLRTDVTPNPSVFMFRGDLSTENGVEHGTPLLGSKGFWLTNGWHIVGLLSKPKIEWTRPYDQFSSNFVVANVRAMSGSVVDKYPQGSPEILEAAFSYRLIPEILAYVPFERFATNHGTNLMSMLSLTPHGLAVRSNYYRTVSVLQTNLHDVRLTFRWPLAPPENAVQRNSRRQTYRLLVGGRLFQTNDPSPSVAPVNIFFFQPSTYVQMP